MVSDAPTPRLPGGRVRCVAGRLARRTQRDESGIGLLEAILAIVILLVVLVPMTLLIATTVQATSNAKEKVTATELAEEQLEQLNNDSLTTLDSDINHDVTQSPITVADITYTVTTFLQWGGVGNAANLCTSGSPPQVLNATATVSWGPGGDQKLAEQSVIDPPYGLPVFYLKVALTANHAYTQLTATANQTIAAGASLTVGVTDDVVVNVTVSSAVNNTNIINVSSFTPTVNYPADQTAVALPSEGYLAVQVNGARGSAPSNVNQVTVTIQSTATGSAASSYTPDSNGCVYEQELPGQYNVSVGTASGFSPPFVDRSDNQTPSTNGSCTGGNPLNVVANSTTLKTWSFDQSGAITFSASGAVPAAGGIPVTVSNSGITCTSGTAVLASATPEYLYPFTSPYQAWYGDCPADMPSSPTSLSVTPGSSQSDTLTGMAVLIINATASGGSFSGTPSATATVVNAGPSTGCNTDQFSLGNLTVNGSTATVQAQVPVGTAGVEYQLVVTDGSHTVNTTVTVPTAGYTWNTSVA